MMLVPLGIAAGTLTTVAGLGGGMLLVLALALLWSPLAALTVTSLALLAGNIHRLMLYRAHVSTRVLVPLLAGLVPGSLIGVGLAVAVPEVLLHALMLGGALLGVVSHRIGARWRVPARALVPCGAFIGMLGATSGGLGALVGPLLLACGISGDVYIATGAASATAMHLARLAGYGAGGLIDWDTMGTAAVLALALMIGNWLGKGLRARISEATRLRIEHGTPLACAALALVSLGR